MARAKIDYGIDLGTTNSAICRMEKGIPVIKKIEATDETMSSCVFFNNKRSIIVGARAYRNMKSDKKRATKSWSKGKSNAYIEFKRTMGTDMIYPSTNMEREYTSEELSSEILKSLKSYVPDENFKSVVITVPAKFTVNQNAATMKAAKLAGFEQCELLQEPIAASMAYGLSSEQKDGHWMVFDFGGGTFDAALLKVEDGIMQVFDTEGDNYLGGKNLDEAIVDKIIIPYLRENYSIEGILADNDKKTVLREAMKTYAEELKNQLSFKEKEDVLSDLGDLGDDEDGEELELDLSVTQEEFFTVIRPLFQKSVDICKELLNRNHMIGDDLDKIILVGGPTHSPLIQKMLKEQITERIESNNPMTAVATGAALYASTKNAEVSETDIEVGVIRLDMGYESTSVDASEWVSVKLDKDAMGENPPEKVWVEFVRGDKAWSSAKVEVNEVGNVIEANLIEGKPNSFSVTAYNEQGTILECFPNELTIIQGTKVGAAPLPYHIGIAVYKVEKEKIVFEPLIGLEKNKPFPAVGITKKSRKTPISLRPGVATDSMSIPVYEADEYKKGTAASLYEYVTDVMVTGDDINQLIPEGSLVDITLKAPSPESRTMEVYFPAFDITVIKELDTAKVQSILEAQERIPKEIQLAQRSINRMKNSNIDVADLEAHLNTVREEHSNSSEKKAVLQHLKEVLRKIEDRDIDTEWDRLEKELRDDFDKLEKANNDLGDEETTKIVNQLRLEVDKVIKNKSVDLGIQVKEQVNVFFFQITLLYQCIEFIRYWNEHFTSLDWLDRSRARQLLNEGLDKINGQPDTEEVRQITVNLMKLLPEDERGNIGGNVIR